MYIILYIYIYLNRTEGIFILLGRIYLILLVECCWVGHRICKFSHLAARLATCGYDAHIRLRLDKATNREYPSGGSPYDYRCNDVTQSTLSSSVTLQATQINNSDLSMYAQEIVRATHYCFNCFLFKSSWNTWPNFTTVNNTSKRNVIWTKI